MLKRSMFGRAKLDLLPALPARGVVPLPIWPREVDAARGQWMIVSNRALGPARERARGTIGLVRRRPAHHEPHALDVSTATCDEEI